MQIYGKKLDGSFGEQAVFSDQNIEINKPYYLAASKGPALEGITKSPAPRGLRFRPATFKPLFGKLLDQPCQGVQIYADLKSPDEILRAHAIEAMSDAPRVRNDNAILAALGDSSALVRKAAAFVVGQLKLLGQPLDRLGKGVLVTVTGFNNGSIKLWKSGTAMLSTYPR